MKKVRIIKEPQERREEIIQAALALFAQKGYEHTTIQDIAEKLDISQGLCYRYFASKSEIFMAAAEHYTQQITKQITTPLPKDMCAVDKFNIIIKRVFKYIMLHSTFEGNRELIKLRAAKFDTTSEQIIKVLIPIIEQGNREKVFNCSDVLTTTRIFVFGVVYTFHTDVSKLDKQAIRLYIKDFLQTLKNLLVPVLGIKDKALLGQGWEDIV